MYIKKNLNYLRSKQGLSLRSLSSISEVSHTVIDRIEKGYTKDPTITTVNKLAEALGIELSEFIFKDLQKHKYSNEDKKNKSYSSHCRITSIFDLIKTSTQNFTVPIILIDPENGGLPCKIKTEEDIRTYLK